MTHIETKRHKDLKKSIYDTRTSKNTVKLWWLGQAGFALKFRHVLLLIDPYLSDFLSKKYKNSEFSHTRMMPPPILPGDIRHLNFVLTTHRHSDHMDPETLPILAKNNPDCRFIIPKAELEWAIKIGIHETQIVRLNDGESFVPQDQICISAIASAHETIKTNEKGEHYFVGYIIELGDMSIYHSGDCVLYPNLANKLLNYTIDLALLPVNGRDDYRKSRNIPGNFTAEEAVRLCLDASINVLLGHHYGMFNFNTIKEEEAQKAFRKGFPTLNASLAQLGSTYIISK